MLGIHEKNWNGIFELPKYSRKRVDLEPCANLSCDYFIDLNSIVENFQEEYKAVLWEIIQLMNVFHPTNFHDSFYNKANYWAKEEFGYNDELTMFLKYHHDKWIERIQNIRDSIIHPYSTKHKPIIIENIRLNKVSGHLQISAPTRYSEDEPPSFSIDDMKEIVNNILFFFAKCY